MLAHSEKSSNCRNRSSSWRPSSALGESLGPEWRDSRGSRANRDEGWLGEVRAPMIRDGQGQSVGRR